MIDADGSPISVAELERVYGGGAEPTAMKLIEENMPDWGNLFSMGDPTNMPSPEQVQEVRDMLQMDAIGLGYHIPLVLGRIETDPDGTSYIAVARSYMASDGSEQPWYVLFDEEKLKNALSWTGTEMLGLDGYPAEKGYPKWYGLLDSTQQSRLVLCHELAHYTYRGHPEEHRVLTRKLFTLLYPRFKFLGTL